MDLSREYGELAQLCEGASAADRELDARIARAMFPGLADLHPLEIAVWRHGDGSRIRALRYSADKNAAMTLVPIGHWIEADAGLRGHVWVYGPRGDEAVSANHDLEPLAISAACLRSHARAKARS
ncbi:hypothetical protein D3Y57_00515 (plasmid) [Sphingomonas paeninsulae]|uniref:Uncharacterized protein n=1 Tax=Sphingomonas paeninsulae TaxID=2319844 RepID=A0A494TBR5_SPHPE|nr:hypothetical protein [Sphingomonas paeninsulae]AYJ84623.1 hypothetical protein D3Y57_00515 [Sphingomonas paeninsulae]